MNYATASRRPNPAAAIGALGIPAGVGALLALGLAIHVTIPDEAPGLTGVQIPIEPIDEPIEPLPEPATSTTSQTVTTPLPDTPPPRPLPPSGPIQLGVNNSGPIGGLPGLGEIETGPVGGFGIPTPRPLFDPVNPAPRGDPGRWIRDNDYRASWINRGYSGVAGFALSIDASGRVSDCSITRSTGHSALDQATCTLLESRARFEPARGSNGEPVAGNYNSSVNWSIPE